MRKDDRELVSEARAKRLDLRYSPALPVWMRATLIEVWSAPEKGRDPDEVRAIVDEEWPE